MHYNTILFFSEESDEDFEELQRELAYEAELELAEELDKYYSFSFYVDEEAAELDARAEEVYHYACIMAGFDTV